jgi:uncharacterized membrane protein YdjX (TVP38/TMEM64 family)
VGVSFNARRAGRVATVLVLVVAVALVVRASGVVDLAGDERRLRSAVDDAGLLGPLLFVGLMVLLVPLNVPGVAFVVPSTALFGTPAGIALSLAGGYVASMIGVVAARRLGRSAFESRMPERVRRWEARLSARGFWGLVAVRSCTYLMQPVDWLCGVSSIPMRTVASATLVGLVPPTLVVALGGGRIVEGVL